MNFVSVKSTDKKFLKALGKKIKGLRKAQKISQGVLSRFRHGGVVVNIAIAHMPERDNAYPFESVAQCAACQCDEFRHAAYRHGNIVLDADPFTLLCLADVSAQLPPVFCLPRIAGNTERQHFTADAEQTAAHRTVG